MIKVAMRPYPDDLKGHNTGIAQVVLNLARYLPDYGIEVVSPKTTSYDLRIGHAAAWPGAEIHYSHGILWSEEYNLGQYAQDVNAELVEAILQAKEIIVPSDWVAMPFRRDLRIDPHVIWHGVNFDEWQHDRKNKGYVLWTKNRDSDGLDPSALDAIAERFPDRQFVTTFGKPRDNVMVLGGAVPFDEMKLAIQSAAVVLMTDRETWGITAAESMAAGVPVLTVNSGAVPDFMKHGVSGYCYEPKNLEDAIQGLEYCLKHRDTLGGNAREIARTLTWHNAIGKVAAVIEKALEPEPAPSLSVVIPCHNYGHVVGRAIESALNQTFPVSKVVVVNDSSMDDTDYAVNSFEDDRIVYRHRKARNVAIARNDGFDECDTKYVIPLDADDWIEPRFAERLIAELEKDKTLGFAYTGVSVYYNDTEIKALPLDWPYPLQPGDKMHSRDWPTDNFNLQFMGENQIPSCTVIRKKAFDRVGGYRARYCPTGAGSEDAELYLRMLAYGWRAKMLRSDRDSLWVHSHGDGYTQIQGYTEKDWTAWHPWTRDYRFPFAAAAEPKNKSHPVRSYEKPVVSVIVPVGTGHKRELVNALDSIEAQTLREWEAIVVYDFPPDDDLEAWYKHVYPYVNFQRSARSSGHIEHRAMGAGHARNIGVMNARAPLVTFLDADDYLSPDFLLETVTEYEKHNSVVYSEYYARMTWEQWQVIGGDVVKDEGLTVVANHNFRDYNPKRAMQRPEGEKPYTWSTVNVVLPKEWHEWIGGFDETMHSWEDCDYLLRLAWAGKGFYRVPKQLFVYNFANGIRRRQSNGAEAELMEKIQCKYDSMFGGKNGM